MPNGKYPKLFIRSKNDLAKHISHHGFSKDQALNLINDVQANLDKYWADNQKQSEPAKEKYVRSARWTPLGILLKKINQKVFVPHDKKLPNFIFGGVSGLDHIKAATYLLGKKRKRTLLKADIKRFFEQVTSDRVENLLISKCQCSPKAARLLSNLFCVPLGVKGSKNSIKAIARGFATSSRLAVWCNLEIFTKLDWLVKKYLKKADPRLSIFVDDIGITASRVTEEEMDRLYCEIKKLFEKSNPNQRLPLNPEKKKITSYMEGMEHLGSSLGRNRLKIGHKTQAKKNRLKSQLSNPLDPTDRIVQRGKYKSLMRYKSYVENSTSAEV